MQVRSSVSLSGGIFSSEVKTVGLATRCRPRLAPREMPRPNGGIVHPDLAVRPHRTCGPAMASMLATLRAGKQGSGTHVAAGAMLTETEKLLIAAAYQAAIEANPADASSINAFLSQSVFRAIGHIDLIGLLTQHPPDRPVSAPRERRLALSVVRQLSRSVEGAALALRLTRQHSRLRLCENPGLEKFAQKLAMYFFKADSYLERCASPTQAPHARHALSGIRRLLREALAPRQAGASGGSCQLGDALRRLPPAEATALAALRNDLWLDEIDADNEAGRRYRKLGELLGGVQACLRKTPTADEPRGTRFCRVAGKIVGGKIDTAMTALKYLQRQRTAPNVTRTAQDTYLTLNDIVARLEQRLGIADASQAAARPASRKSPPSRRVIQGNEIRYASYRSRTDSESASGEPASRQPAQSSDAHPAPTDLTGSDRQRTTSRSIPLQALRLDLPAHREYLDLYGRLLILRKQKEYITRFIGNLPASMGTEYLENRSLGDDVIDSILAQRELQMLRPDVLGVLKGALQKYNRLALQPQTLDTWRRALHSEQPHADAEGSSRTEAGEVSQPAERLTRVKAQGTAETRQRLKQALTQLAEELHFGKQFTFSSASGHLASTKGIVPVFTGGIFDVFAELAYSRGMKFTIGNNSTGSFLEVKWTGLRSGDIGVNAGLPLVANPVLGASVSVDAGLANQFSEGIIFRFPRDASFHSDLANNPRLAELLAFLIDEDAGKDGKNAHGTPLMAVLERFPEVSIGHVTEKRTRGSMGVTGSLSIGPKIPRVAIGAVASVGISATREFSDMHREADGHNCRSTTRKSWVIAANGSGGMRTGMNLAGLIHPTQSGAPSNGTSREVGAQAADNIIRANRFMGKHVSVSLNLRGYAEEYAEHLKEGQVQPNTSWRAKTFFTRDMYLNHLRQCSEELIDTWSKTVTLQAYGNLDSEPAKQLYTERRAAHAAWLRQHIANIEQNFEANTTYTMNYDLRPESAKTINQYRAVRNCLLSLGDQESAREYESLSRRMMRDPQSYVIANILVNRTIHRGRERSLGLVAYGTHSAKAEEQTFNFYGPIPNKHIVLTPPARR